MKQLNSQFLLVLAFLPFMAILSGCTKNADSGKSNDGIAPLFISSVSVPSTVSGGSSLLSSGTLGVFRLADSDAGLVASANNLYTCISGSWTATDANVPIAGTTCVCAYSPYNASYGDATQLPLTAWMGLTTETSSHDLLYALPTKASSVSGEVSDTSFSLNSAYTMLRFTLGGFSAPGEINYISSLSIYNKNLPASGSVNIIGASAAYGSTTKQSTSWMTCTVNKSLSEHPVVDVLLPPCTLYDLSNTTLNLIITIDGVQRVIKQDLAANNLKSALVPGAIYPINVDLNGGLQPESNSYIVAPGTTIYIPVSRATVGNTSNFPDGSFFTCGLLWSDVSATHVVATAVDRYIKVTAGNTVGNSVIYAKNAKGDIVWSWHIWVTDYNPDTNSNGKTYANTSGLIWMDRNLGATAVANGTSTFSTCGGLMYQWGRKDPFPGSDGSIVGRGIGQTIYGYIPPSDIGGTAVSDISNDNYVKYFSVGTSPVTVSNAFSYSVQYPLVYFGPWGGSTATATMSTTVEGGAYSWNSSVNSKTIYDPCPVGWRVPISGLWADLKWRTAMTNANTVTAYDHFESVGDFPATGYRFVGNGELYDVGGIGGYWSALVGGVCAYCLHFDSYNISDSGTSYSRSYGFPVRCVKN